MARINIGEGTSPTPTQQQKQQARQAMRGFNAALDDLTTNWNGLTANQKTEAVRTMLVIVARAVRWLMLRD